MNNRDIAKYAALIAAGVITEDVLSDLIGDDTIIQKIMSVAGASAIVGAASNLIDDAVDTTMDVAEGIVDTLNPFKW